MILYLLSNNLAIVRQLSSMPKSPCRMMRGEPEPNVLWWSFICICLAAGENSLQRLFRFASREILPLPESEQQNKRNHKLFGVFSNNHLAAGENSLQRLYFFKPLLYQFFFKSFTQRIHHHALCIIRRII